MDADRSLSDEDTFTGKAKRRPAPDVSIGDERTLGDWLGDQDTVIDDIEVVDLEARYKIEGTLGQGGMGAVLLATDTRLDRKVAIKRILGEAARSKSAILRFLTEAKAIAALNHPNIVQIYDYGRAKDGPFLIMEFVDGGNLLDLCKDRPVAIDTAVTLMSQICDGLGTAHEQGIVHRDIKPANILVNKAGLPKLTDFGLAKAEAHDQGMTMSGAVMGTPDFMPPEQRRDAAEVDHRSDLWSLAATFYQMLTGRSPKIIRIKEVPAPLQPVLEKALEEEKDQRFQSATELRDAIRAAVGLGGTRTAIPQASLLEGQCPACGTINSDMGRKFCRQCQGSLRTPCLQCDKDMPAWDAVCGECGGRQSDVAATRKAELVGEQQQAKDAYHKGDFIRAVAIGDRLAALRHSRLVKFADWGQAFLKAVKEQQARLEVTAAERLAEARAHRHAFDYAAAIRALESIPAAFMDEPARGLLAECRNNRDEAGKLLKVIAGRIKAKDLDGLLPQVERAVALQGNRADLKKLQEQLRLREAKRSSLNNHVSPNVGIGSVASNSHSQATNSSLLQQWLLASWLAAPRKPLLIAAPCAILLLVAAFAWLLAGDKSSRRAATVIRDPATVNRKANPAETESVDEQAGPNPAALGISYELLPETNARWLKSPTGGVIINGVMDGSAAEESGLQAGDILLKFDNATISRPEDFSALEVGEMPVGSRHAVTVLRNGKELKVGVTLKERAAADHEGMQLQLNELSRISVEGVIHSIQLTGPRLCCGTSEGVGVWNIADGRVRQTIWTDGAAIDLTADGEMAVIGEKLGGLATWNTATGQKHKDFLENGDEELVGCRIDAEGKQIATLHKGCVLRFWDTAKAVQIDEIRLTGEGEKYDLIIAFDCVLGPFSPSGKFLLLKNGSKVFVWNVRNRTIDWSLNADSPINAFAPSPDWSNCALALKTGAIKIVSFKDSSTIATLRGHKGDIWGVSWHGDNWLASAGDSSTADRTVRVWNVVQQVPVWQFIVEEPFFGPRAISFDPVQARLWTGAKVLREYEIPPLAKEAWRLSAVHAEAFDFTGATRKD
jgi:hypothetical protein